MSKSNKAPESPPDSKIHVICDDLGHTGSLSLTEALEILGYKTYHYTNFNHASAWSDFAEGKC